MHTPLRVKHLQLTARWRYSHGGLHAAYDYRAGNGTPVHAVRDGIVLACNDGVTNTPVRRRGAPSNWILLGITYKGRKATVYYQHLFPGLLVRKGQRVKAGDVIAKSGSSGNASGPHLHFAAMWGHRDSRGERYVYMNDIGPGEGAPRNGTASNGICIYPPSLVFQRRPAPAGKSRWGSGLVIVDELRSGTRDSDSVRRLQYRLNRIPLDGGRELPITGNYLEQTRAEVTKWQIEKDGCKPGTKGADGNLGPKQARKLFGSAYTLKNGG